MPESLSARTPTPTDIGKNVRQIQRRIATAAARGGRSAADITVIAVSKTAPVDAICQAFSFGITDFGESRVQEAAAKIEHLRTVDPKPVWHMVGHLQTNKAKLAGELFDCIHSIDSVKVADAVSHYATRDISVLVQVNVAGEDTKSGFSPGDLSSALTQISRLPHIKVRGLMTIAPYTRDTEEVRPIFRELRMLGHSLALEHLSMGMTDDFEVAVEEGATMVRIGRAIFGDREVQP